MALTGERTKKWEGAEDDAQDAPSPDTTSLKWQRAFTWWLHLLKTDNVALYSAGYELERDAAIDDRRIIARVSETVAYPVSWQGVGVVRIWSA